jgi:hypothetical protein
MAQRLFGLILGGAIAIYAGVVYVRGGDPLGVVHERIEALYMLLLGLGICGITILLGIIQNIASAFRKPENPKSPEGQKPAGDRN